MLCLNENASQLWYDNIYIWIISVSLGMNEISPRWRFAFHFTVFPWCCSVSQRRDTQEQSPWGPGCCQHSRQSPCFPLLLPAAGEHELVWKGRRDESPSSPPVLWLPESKHWITQPTFGWLFFVVVGFFVGCFFFLIGPPDLELKPSIHFTDNLILSSSQQHLPQLAQYSTYCISCPSSYGKEDSCAVIWESIFFN